MSTPLAGIIPPMVTPLVGPDALDVPGLKRLVEHLIAGHVSGLFVLGTTGEGPSLSYRLRRELIDRTCRLVRGRVPVLVGITDTAACESLSLARHAADAGAYAAVMAPPYYFPLGQPELFQYTEHLISELPLPLFLYNMPATTKVVFEPETVRRLVDNPRIIGIKDSSGDLAYFDQVLTIARERPDWSVLVGPEHLLVQAVTRGAHGGVNGGANLHPRLFVDLYKAVTRGDETTIAELQRQVLHLGKLYQVGRHASAIIKSVKCGLSLLGICNDFVAEPFRRFEPPEKERVRLLLRELGLLSDGSPS
jgi:dihydrodipicolinate synthase/N-acetylneuraminate lyase